MLKKHICLNVCGHGTKLLDCILCHSSSISYHIQLHPAQDHKLLFHLTIGSGRGLHQSVTGQTRQKI